MSSNSKDQNDEAAQLWKAYSQKRKTLPSLAVGLAFAVAAIIVVVGVWIVIFK